MHYPKMLAVAFAAALTLAVSPIYAQNTSTEPRSVTLDDVWGVYAFGGKSINGLRSMADGVHYTRLTRGEGGTQIEKFDYATGTSKGVLVTSKELEAGKNQPFAIQNYTFSPDEQYLLLETDLASIYRHSYTAKVGLYKIKDRSFVSLGDKPVQNAQLSPNGKWVAYVEDNHGRSAQPHYQRRPGLGVRRGIQLSRRVVVVAQQRTSRFSAVRRNRRRLF
jgi:hypothetical protein